MSWPRQLLPVFMLALGFLILAAALIYDTAQKQYELALESERRIAEKGISLRQESMANHTLATAHDNDSIENLLVDHDPQWAEENIGSWAIEGLQLDGALVVWSENRLVHHANRHGSGHLDDPSAFPDEVTGVIEAARQNTGAPGERPQAATGFFRDDKGLHMAAAAPLVWEDTRDHVVEEGSHAVLVVFLTFDESFLEELASGLGFEALQIATEQPSGSAAHLPLNSHAGEPVALLSWPSTGPGLGMLREMALPLAVAVLIKLVLSIFFVRHAYKRARLFQHYHSLLEQRTQELQASKEEAEALSRSKSRFLATMSHELRTPLNAILGFSELLQKDYVKSLPIQRIQEYARDIHSSGSYLLSLINDILDLSKIEAGRYDLDERRVRLSSLTDESMALVRNMADGKQIALHEQIEDAELNVDPRAFKQILANLVSNALKYSESGTNVWLESSQQAGGGLEIRVRDEGSGMSDEDIAKALEAFGRSDDAHKKGVQGTGLGLTICQSLVQMHGGTLDIRSVPGQGTTVALHVPAERVLSALCNAETPPDSEKITPA
ncbi:ATP-binding protein [Fodinicurvata halophila]|uniref:histidine kinase n=1 Tax=Fodinicurvata halophila TaxID=1419723 RepID=A0ABV8UMH2_9PROT